MQKVNNMSGENRLENLKKWSFSVFDTLNSNTKYILCFSGGKDSHVILGLYIEWLSRNNSLFKKSITVVFSDTFLESKHLYKLVKNISVVCKKNNIEFIEVSPPTNKTFFAVQFGLGYPVPYEKKGQSNRWCTNELKVRPMNSVKGIPIVGTHLGESVSRDSKLNSCGSTECGVDLMQNTITPIAKWRNCDVWDWIILYGDSVLYEGFSDLISKTYDIADSSNSMRMGCAFCPVVARSTIKKNVESKIVNNYVLKIRDILEDLRKAPRINNPRTKKAGAISIEYRKKYWELLKPYFSLMKKDGFITDEIIDYVEKKLSENSYPPTYSEEWIENEEKLLKLKPKQLSLFDVNLFNNY